MSSFFTSFFGTRATSSSTSPMIGTSHSQLGGVIQLPPVPSMVVQENIVTNVNTIPDNSHNGGAAWKRGREETSEEGRKKKRKASNFACLVVNECTHGKRCKACIICGVITKHETRHKCRKKKPPPTGNRPEQDELFGNNETVDGKSGEYEENEDGIATHGEGDGYSTPKSAYNYLKLAEINKNRTEEGKKALGPRSDGAEIGLLMKGFSKDFDELSSAKREDFIKNIYPNIKKATRNTIARKTIYKPWVFSSVKFNQRSASRATTEINHQMNILHSMGLRASLVVVVPDTITPYLTLMPPGIASNPEMNAALLRMQAALLECKHERFKLNPKPVYPSIDVEIQRLARGYTRSRVEKLLLSRWKEIGGPLAQKGQTIPWSRVCSGEILVGGWPVCLPMKKALEKYSKLELVILLRVSTLLALLTSFEKSSQWVCRLSANLMFLPSEYDEGNCIEE